MTVIVDCGSSKTEWCFISHEGELLRIVTGGMNALLLTCDEMAALIAEELLAQASSFVASTRRVYFYGAGCVSPEVCATVADALGRHFVGARVEVATDLLAAARALCGDKEGIACILGTGSNSCYFNGKNIVDNVSPLGYILGDEGSGAVLGRMLVADVLKRQLPDEICEKFHVATGLDRLEIIRRVYREPMPNRFLASLSPFLLANIDCPQVHRLVVDAFRAFFRRNVAAYPASRFMSVNFVGSVAFYYRELLSQAAESEGFHIGRILKSPMEGLIKYHLTVDYGF